jgi:hypothetical protein
MGMLPCWMTVVAQPGKLVVSCVAIGLVQCFPADSKCTLPMICPYMRPLVTKMPLNHGRHLIGVHTNSFGRTSPVRDCFLKMSAYFSHVCRL